MDPLTTYRELPPPRAVAGAVACRWTGVVAAGGPERSRVLPDACVDLIWQEGVGTHVAGPDTGPVLVDLPPGTVLVGVRFRPGAGGAALGLPLHRLADRRVDLVDLHPALARRLHGRLSPSEALQRLSDGAVALAEAGPPDPVARALAERLTDPGFDARVEVDRLAGEAALSPRQLRRRCHDAVGYGPKLLHRVLRMRAWLRLLAAEPGAGLARLAVDGGYADQAHLTRECRQLTGLTPATHARTLAPAGAGTAPASGPGADPTVRAMAR